jgi:predicted dithiol-disulfide oxidoreductase (DUF899 family)
LEREKELTRMGDELARQRRELPWVPVEKEYPLQTEGGASTLAELFDGRPELVIYHFMFGPGYHAGCPACSSTADSFNGVLAHVKACDVTMICVSRAPLGKLLAYRERMGWSFTWASSHYSDFNVDYGVSAREPMMHDSAAPRPEASELAPLKLLNEQPAVRENLPLVAAQNASATGTDLEGYFSEGHGVSTFAREGGTVYHCYSSFPRPPARAVSGWPTTGMDPQSRNAVWEHLRGLGEAGGQNLRTLAALAISGLILTPAAVTAFRSATQ